VTCDRSAIFSGYSGFLHNKIDRHDIAEILLNVESNKITLTLIDLFYNYCMFLE